MGSGYLIVKTVTANGVLPVGRASVTVTSADGSVLYSLMSDANGATELMTFETPDIGHTFEPLDPGPVYATVDVKVTADRFNTVIVHRVQIYDTITMILPVNLTPLLEEKGAPAASNIEEIFIPKHQLEETNARVFDTAEVSPMRGRILQEVVIPNFVTVHLGKPGTAASNVRVAYKEYIKNVCTHEIYSTWPLAALEANILAQISLLLNRIFTEWYPSKGYAYDITNSTAYDQFYVHGGGYASNIGVIVDRIFNQYIRRQGHLEPFYAEYCDGIKADCPGMKQWGTESLARQGLNAFEILKRYYPSDIQIIQTNNISDNTSSFPGYSLAIGSTGPSVKWVQRLLNRITRDFPGIPNVGIPDGVYGQSTANSVSAFQRTFNLPVTGIVNSATWYEISRVFAAVTKLAELGSEGIFVGIGPTPPTTPIALGARGALVAQLQFLLNYISQYYPSIPPVVENAYFDQRTKDSVLAFQEYFSLVADGQVGPATWNMLYSVYKSIQKPEPPGPQPPPIQPYPGAPLRIGSTGSNVLLIQRILNHLSIYYPQIPRLAEDGIFGQGTHNAVVQFQTLFRILPIDGIVGPVTWNAIMTEFARITQALPPYPGTAARLGSTGQHVRTIQTALNAAATRYQSIPSVTVDGVFGAATDNAIRIFQKLFGLTVDGIVGPATWERLMQAAAAASPSVYAALSEAAAPLTAGKAPSGGIVAAPGLSEVYYRDYELDPEAFPQYGQAPPQYETTPYTASGLPAVCREDWVKPLLSVMLWHAVVVTACGGYWG